jgi:hypothetical protein
MNTSAQWPESSSRKQFPNLHEVEALATDILRRLESGEPLSSVLSGARRLAELTHDDVSAKWLLLESIGTNGLAKVGPGEARAPQEIRALEMFFDLHSMMDMKAFDELSWQKLKRGEFPPDTTVAARGIPDLERITPPLKIPSTPDAVGVDYKQRMKSQVIHGEIQTILNRVRQTVHQYVAKVARQTRDTLRIVDRLGPDAPAVFQVAGTLLDELRNAVESLDRPGMASTAAQQARTTLLTLGRRLYTGPNHHVSPIDGTAHQVQNEINRLHAYIDQLWERADQERRVLLRDAHKHVDLAYELGSRAKNPAAITQAQAEEAVMSAYRVAQAISLSAGFPVPASALSAPPPT